jgi:RNA polymerase subunit RPABC4/transcription elongation factor Spt4
MLIVILIVALNFISGTNNPLENTIESSTLQDHLKILEEKLNSYSVIVDQIKEKANNEQSEIAKKELLQSAEKFEQTISTFRKTLEKQSKIEKKDIEKSKIARKMNLKIESEVAKEKVFHALSKDYATQLKEEQKKKRRKKSCTDISWR